MVKYITEEKTQVANKHMKICSASLIKITVRNHSISICVENIKKPQNIQLIRQEQWQPLHIASGTSNWHILPGTPCGINY